MSSDDNPNWDAIYDAMMLALREGRAADARRWHGELCALESDVARGK